MTLCLAIAAPLADSPRREAYLRAAVRYADRVTLPAQLPTGAFPNGRWFGRVHVHPYAVATATQASSLAALGAVTGDLRYLEAAERAGLWLAEQFRSDGYVTFAPHDTDEARSLAPTAFGDLFYMVEALTWIERFAVREEAKARARLALERYLWGPFGLRRQAVNGYWWSPRNPWTDSKMGGMLYILARSGRWNQSPALEGWTQQALAWLADPALSRQIGVLAPLPSMTGRYGMVATGFAGIGIAELAEPGVFLPAVPAPQAQNQCPGSRLARN
jgi:hypothetical protein